MSDCLLYCKLKYMCWSLCLTDAKAWPLCVKTIGDSWANGWQQTDNRLIAPPAQFPTSPQLSCIELFLKWLYFPHAHSLYDLWSPTQAPHHLYCLWFALTCGRWALSNWDMCTEALLVKRQKRRQEMLKRWQKLRTMLSINEMIYLYNYETCSVRRCVKSMLSI